jgi:hypothetical protein
MLSKEADVGFLNLNLTLASNGGSYGEGEI